MEPEEGAMAAELRTRTTAIERVRRWLWPIVGALVGVLVGLAFFTFGYANGSAYFGKDPQACSQCHVMRPMARVHTRAAIGPVRVSMLILTGTPRCIAGCMGNCL